VSLGTGMTQQHKFRDPWWTLLFSEILIQIVLETDTMVV